MEANKNLFSKVVSVEVVLLAVILLGSTILVAIYPENAWFKSLVTAILALVVRISFKLSGSDDDTQVIKKD